MVPCYNQILSFRCRENVYSQPLQRNDDGTFGPDKVSIERILQSGLYEIDRFQLPGGQEITSPPVEAFCLFNLAEIFQAIDEVYNRCDNIHTFTDLLKHNLSTKAVNTLKQCYI